MSVTIFPNGPVANTISSLPNIPGFLPNLYRRGECKEIIQASVSKEPHRSWNLANNGFVDAVHTAYSEHHHLEIRPDDVWFAILTQLSYYVNANSEEMRGMFVPFEGKKKLVLEYDAISRYNFDFGIFANDMSKLVQENIVDPDLRAWIQPTFSTTTRKESIIASIIMMSTLQKYFEYTLVLMCGLPSVTIFGERADWEDILHRIEKLPSFGTEPKQFYSLLKPVLKRFVMSLDTPDSPEVIDFWQRPLHRHPAGSGEDEYSGWMTAFVFWNSRGKSLYPRSPIPDVENDPAAYTKLDGVNYHRVSKSDIPPGWVEAPVKIIDNGKEIKAVMAAGSMGLEWTRKDGPVNSPDIEFDSLRPVSEWWIYEESENWEKQVQNDPLGLSSNFLIYEESENWKKQVQNDPLSLLSNLWNYVKGKNWKEQVPKDTTIDTPAWYDEVDEDEDEDEIVLHEL